MTRADERFDAMVTACTFRQCIGMLMKRDKMGVSP